MKIAIASDNGRDISSHFGRAEFYVVVELEQGKIINRRLVSKESTSCNCQHEGEGEEHHHEQHHDDAKHKRIFEPIQDCDVLIARGMGSGAFKRLENMGVQALLTDMKDIDEALKAYLEGKLLHVPGRVHH